MKTPRGVLVVATFLFSCVAGCGGKGGGSSAIPAGKVAADAKTLVGQKVKVSGIYKQGFSKGGRPGDPWVVVIADAPAANPPVYCVVPAMVEIKGNYPKLEAEGTLAVETSGRGGVYLNGCTYKVVPLRRARLRGQVDALPKPWLKVRHSPAP
mgnify:CR=1 FL=1